ncbi:hypothetical protein INT43_007411 [Umbelopsis isabellina]|uniref:AD domain-containing protein n=1 Tax=Mortierella isabellina TaxID=91625 RepID=A0A8H7UEA1_MORIS|nr:hypothetical protein INT43_007411 [Umbelopsis isabellina]
MSVADTTSESRLYGLTPEEIITACGHLVTVKLQNNDTQSGYLYVIDPFNKSVILKHETQDIAIVILRHQVVSIEANYDQPAKLMFVTNPEEEDINEDSAAMKNRKQNAIELLEASRVPIKYSTEHTVIQILDTANLYPPYVPTSIQCDNPIIRKRVSDLLQGMPSWSVSTVNQ